MKVVLTDEAKADLRNIARWIASDNPARAISFAAELRSRCATLRDKPLAYPVALEIDGVPIRRRRYRRYGIFYRTSDELIEVLHIVHGARDYRALFVPVE